MGFIDDVREEQASRKAPGSRCLMCETVKAWPEPDASDLAAALADRSIYSSTIITVLKSRGIEATDSQVGNHRRKHL